MIVILYDNGRGRASGNVPGFEVAPDTELLNEPYLARLAEEYRRIGARDVVWADGAGGGAEAWGAGAGRVCELLDEGLRAEGPVGRYETVFIADFRLWPDEETTRVIGRHKQSDSTLTRFVDASPQASYEEVLERPAQGEGCGVTRRYQGVGGGAQEDGRRAALLARPTSLSFVWQKVVDALRTRDVAHLDELASHAQLHLGGRANFIDTPASYLRLTERMLGGLDSLGSRARLVGDGIWAMPGAFLGAGCDLRGPVLLGRNCRVGRRTRIVGPAVVGDSVEIAEDCFLGSSVVMGGARLAKGTRVWRSILGPRVRLSQGECVSQSCVSPEWLGARAFGEPAKEFAEVVVPSREALRGCNWRLFAALKRGLDIVGSLAGLAVTLPLYPFIALAIKLDSPGPVFFAHRRQTLGGKEFGCLKFRSMVQNAHALQSQLSNEVDGPQFHIDKDPRLTRVGRFLRRTNLDEIPQLLNVLLGHMSLVGPRPSPDGENQYCPAWRQARLSVRAGLTGMWQVERGPRTAGDFQQWVHLDTKYVREVSLRTDLRLLWKTIRQFLRLP